MTLDRAAFFAAVRVSLFDGRLTEGQVQGMDAMLDTAPPNMDAEALAYCFATAFRETGRAMQPVEENLNYKSAARIREVWPTRFPTTALAQPYVRNPQALANRVYGGRMGNVGADDGWLYRGRGLPQITGRDNYAKASRKLGVDLVTHPELALQPSIAARIMYAGMTEGWFTGKKLSDYFGAGKSDPVNARRIINGLDEAAKIAGSHTKFLAALIAADMPLPAPKPAPPPPQPPAVEAPAVAQALPGLFSWVASLFRRRPVA